MNLSIEVRTLSALLLIVTILLIGTITIYLNQTTELTQMSNTYTNSIQTIENYCDINIDQINQTIYQENLKIITTAKHLQ